MQQHAAIYEKVRSFNIMCYESECNIDVTLSQNFCRGLILAVNHQTLDVG